MTSPASHRLLVIDDEPDLRTLYELTLLREGYAVDTAGSVDDALQQLAQHTYSAIITDMRLPDGTGLEVLKQLESSGRSERVIVITAYGSAENAVNALKAGAYDYLTKPVDLKQFRSVVQSAVGAKAGEPAVRPASKSMPASPNQGTLARLVGHSPAIAHVRTLIDKVAKSMAPVLLWGESGTGKELVAKSIHEVSARGTGPFIAVNCGAIPEHLLEAEFFGYRKGAFTGATEDRDGFFQAAQGGTLFLDEIGDLPLSMQSKLLRAIQERAIRPVGVTNEMPVDVRILSATHKDLACEVQNARFRQDLYYRLNVIQITLPALRERMSDLPQLTTRILDKIAAESRMPCAASISESAMAALAQYTFPGNIRELENLLQRAVALCTDGRIEAQDLGLTPAKQAMAPDTLDVAPQPSWQDTQPSQIEPTSLAVQSAAAQPSSPASPQPPAALPSDLASHMDQVERDILVQALEKHRLNRTAAGASLGLSLRQMRYRMARLGVKVTDQGLVLGERFDPEQDE